MTQLLTHKQSFDNRQQTKNVNKTLEM